MKILFLTDNFPPESNAPAIRTLEHCREWVKLGCEVKVLTCVPNFPQGKIFQGYKNKLIQKETLEGIEIIRVWSFIAPNAGFLKRIIDFSSYAWMSFWVGLFIKADVIIGTSPQFFTAVSAKNIAFFTRTPWIMEVRDLWPESIAAVGALRKDTLAYKYLKFVEQRLYQKADKIIPVTNSFATYIKTKISDQEKVKVITNGVNRTNFEPVPKDAQLVKLLHLENKFVVGYIGTHGMAHALDFILECAKDLKDDKELLFIFQGDGAEKQNLLSKASREGIQNVKFLPFVPKSEVKRYISILDVALVNLKKNPTFHSVIPSKIFENASMEKPILLGVEGESKNIVESNNAGIAFIPENKQDFLQSLQKIREPEVYQKCVEGSRTLANSYNRSSLAKEMLDFIKN